MLKIFHKSNKIKIILFIIFVSCSISNDTSVEDVTTTVPKTTTTILMSDNYLDYRDLKVFKASTVSDAHMNITMEYIELSENLLFTDKRLKMDKLYPINLVQLDSENYESAIQLEKEYCDYLKNIYPQTYDHSNCSPNNKSPEEDGSIGLFTYDGQVQDSSISGTPSGSDCCYLFMNRTFDLSWDSRSQAVVTIHEMYHIFQISNFVDFNYEEQNFISGKKIGSDFEDKPFWMEGYATFFGNLYYARSIDDFEMFRSEMRQSLYSCYCGNEQEPNLIDKFLDGPELYNVTWDDWAVGYQIGAWFIAYLTNIHGEQTMYDFWINSQSGIYFPENFLETFGKDYKSYEKDFRDFLSSNSEDEVMLILPTN